jgi:hypothetical protein
VLRGWEIPPCWRRCAELGRWVANGMVKGKWLRIC